MRRRRLLGVLGGLAFVAGCSEAADDPPDGSPPTSQPTDTATPLHVETETTSEPTSVASSEPAATADASEFRAAFAASVEELGASVVALDVSDRIVALEYASRRNDYEQIAAEIGAIAGNFFREVERGWDVDRLDSTLLDASETPRATWYAKVAWLEAFRNDEISPEELSQRILETLERVED